MISSMGLAEFSRIDIVTETEHGERWLLVAGVGFAEDIEAQSIMQLLIKLSNYESAAATSEPAPSIEVICRGEPPEPVLELLTAKRIAVWTDTKCSVAARGVRSEFELREGAFDLDALQARNALDFAKSRELPWPPTMKGIEQADEMIIARRELEDLGEDDVDEELFDGNLIVLIGAYAGEFLRAEVGGRWRLEPTPGLQPLWFAAGPKVESPTKVNLLGKVRKALINGREDSVASMVSVMISIVRDGR
jgi:hypothetical protein